MNFTTKEGVFAMKKKFDGLSVLLILTVLLVSGMIIMFVRAINGLEYKVSVLETKIERIEEDQENKRRVVYEERG